jgi:transmembrane protein, putative
MRKHWFVCATFLVALSLVCGKTKGEDKKPFITRWQGTAGQTLRIPIVGTNFKIVVKKEGVTLLDQTISVEKADTPYILNTDTDGEYIVEAGPQNVQYIQFVEDKAKRGSAEALLAVEQFGDVEWTTMFQAFYGCKNMTFGPSIDKPDLSRVTDMSQMFRACSKFNEPIGNWDVSSVTKMVATFFNCPIFNQNLNDWDVSHVATMSQIFRWCVKFNQPLDKWKVSNVTNMVAMFMSCREFAQTLSSWDVSNVTDMNLMFAGCDAYDEDLSGWALNKCHVLQLPTGMSTANYDKFLQYFASKEDSPKELSLTAMNLKYTTAAKAARTKLINEKRWSIVHDTPEGGNNYNSFIIGGFQVNSDNIGELTKALTDAHVLKKGSVSLDISKEPAVVTLNNAVIEPTTLPYALGMTGMYPGLIIKLIGENYILGSMSLGKLDIVGNSTEDKLLVNSSSYALQIGGANSPLTIQNCTAVFESEKENTIKGHVQFSSMTVDNAVVKVRAHNEFSPITSFKSFALTNCKIVYPTGAQFADAQHGVVGAKGVLLKDEWLIIHPVTQPFVPVSTVNIKPDKLSMALGTITHLKAVFEPSDATIQEVTWSSTDTNIAEVDKDGNVTAKRNGSATINIITINGNKTATCTVTVTIPVTGVTLTPETAELKVGETKNLIITVAPETATNKKYTCTSDKESVATVDNTGLITAKSVGTAKITVTTEDGNKTATCTVTVTKPTAVDDAALATISVFPNLFQEQLKIIKPNDENAIRYALINALGIKMRSGVLNERETIINTENLETGLYVLRLNCENGAEKAFRLVKY